MNDNLLQLEEGVEVIEGNADFKGSVPEERPVRIASPATDYSLYATHLISNSAFP